MHFSGTRHDEDQPSHLLVHDRRLPHDSAARSTATRARASARRTSTRWSTPATAAAAADQRVELRPLQDVRHHGPVSGDHWVPPEGGGGPAVRRHVSARSRTGSVARASGCEAAAIARGRLSRHRRAGPHVALAGRRPRAPRRDHRAPGRLAGHGVLARAHPAGDSTTSATAASSSSPATTSTASGSRRIIHRFGYATARGSTSRNAARAALRAKRRDGRRARRSAFTRRRPARAGAGRRSPAPSGWPRRPGNPIAAVPRRGAPHWTAPSWDRIADSAAVQPRRRRRSASRSEVPATRTTRCSRPSARARSGL